MMQTTKSKTNRQKQTKRARKSIGVMYVFSMQEWNDH